jgi:hypothetical protein
LETYNICQRVYIYILEISGNSLGKFKHMLSWWGLQEVCPLENVDLSRENSFATSVSHWSFYKYLIAREAIPVLLPVPLIPL